MEISEKKDTERKSYWDFPQLTRKPMAAETKSRSWETAAETSGVIVTEPLARKRRRRESNPMEATAVIWIRLVEREAGTDGISWAERSESVF